eukprot:scaffold53417_cov33-Attheya_sp.AAC.1
MGDRGCTPSSALQPRTYPNIVAMATYHPLPSSRVHGGIPTWVAMAAIHINIGHPQYTVRVGA